MQVVILRGANTTEVQAAFVAWSAGKDATKIIGWSLINTPQSSTVQFIGSFIYNG